MWAFIAPVLVASAAALQAERAALLDLIRGCVPDGQYTGSPAAARRIEAACSSLEAAAGGDSMAPKFPRDLMLLDGTWRLIYTSTAVGVPPEQIPSEVLDVLPAPMFEQPLREVEQSVDVYGRRVVNRLVLSPWPMGSSPLGGVLRRAPLLGDTLAALEGAAVRLELDHTFSVEGEGSGGRRSMAASGRIALNLERVRRTLEDMGDEGGLLGGLIPRESKYALPAPLSAASAGEFDTPYCDETLRISRAAFPGRELRVFERVGAAPAGAGATRQSPEEWQKAEDELAAAEKAAGPDEEYFDVPEVD